VSGVVPALKPRDDIGPFGQPIDNLAFSLVAPLGAYDDYVGHVCPFYSENPRRYSGTLGAAKQLIRRKAGQNDDFRQSRKKRGL
jgi:hypothetical protein